MVSMPSQDSDNNLAIISTLIVRCWKDSDYCSRFLEDPLTLCKEAGLSMPEGVKFIAKQDTNKNKNIVLPGKDVESALPLLNDFIKSHPLQDSQSLTILQNTDTTNYIIIPEQPDQIDLSLTEDQMLEAATGGDTVAVNESVAVNVLVVIAGAVSVFVAILLYPFNDYGLRSQESNKKIDLG